MTAFYKILTGYYGAFWTAIHYQRGILPEQNAFAVAALLDMAEDKRQPELPASTYRESR